MTPANPSSSASSRSSTNSSGFTHRCTGWCRGVGRRYWVMVSNSQPTAREAGLVTKSNLILGLGEERHEITEAMRDLRAVGCELLTITQYLRPTPRHHPVERWVKPEEFVELREEALELGFAGVMSGPLVRSSYRAGRLYAQAMGQRSDPALAR